MILFDSFGELKDLEKTKLTEIPEEIKEYADKNGYDTLLTSNTVFLYEKTVSDYVDYDLNKMQTEMGIDEDKLLTIMGEYQDNRLPKEKNEAFKEIMTRSEIHSVSTKFKGFACYYNHDNRFCGIAEINATEIGNIDFSDLVKTGDYNILFLSWEHSKVPSELLDICGISKQNYPEAYLSNHFIMKDVLGQDGKYKSETWQAFNALRQTNGVTKVRYNNNHISFQYNNVSLLARVIKNGDKISVTVNGLEINDSDNDTIKINTSWLNGITNPQKYPWCEYNFMYGENDAMIEWLKEGEFDEDSLLLDEVVMD